MIIETLIASATVIVVSSLVFSNVVMNKVRRWELEDSGEVVVDNQPDVKPFQEILIGTACLKCRVLTSNGTRQGNWVVGMSGPGNPVLCRDGKCPVKRSHFHVSCRSCNSSWMMETADHKQQSSAVCTGMLG